MHGDLLGVIIQGETMVVQIKVVSLEMGDEDNSHYSLQAELTRFDDDPDMGFERERVDTLITHQGFDFFLKGKRSCL